MSNYSLVKIAEDFYSIEQGFVRSFLICGKQKALLIDTGVGDVNLKECIEKITTLPVMVIFTHADGDHVGGANQFEDRFMHPSEFAYYENKSKQPVEMQPIFEGEIIDLGRYTFEVMLLPGHTPGSIAFLEKDKRFLIGGDCIQTGDIFMFGVGRNLQAFRASMQKLQQRIDEFDIIYSSHYKLEVNTQTIQTLYDVAGKLLENSIEGIPMERFDGKIKAYRENGVGFFRE